MTEIIELFQALERNKNDGSFGSDIHQTIALLNLLIRVAPVLNASTAGEAIRNKDFLRVAPILDYIRDNLAEPLTLDQIAGRFFISKHYLCRIFKSATGFSVMEYIIYSRILRARSCSRRGSASSRRGAVRFLRQLPFHPHLWSSHRHLHPAATPRSTRPATRSCSGTPTTLTADSPTSARPAVNINIRKPPFGKRGAVFPFSRLFSLRISF